MSKHYLIDENHNLVEGYSAQEVLSILEQAIADGSLANVVAGQAIVDKLKCCVTGGTNQVAFVTQAKYNELKASDSLVNNCMYIITDDTTAEDIDATLKTLTNTVNGIMDGTQTVPKATSSEYADLLNDTHRTYVGNTSVQITEAGVYLVRIMNKLNSSTANCDFYTDVIWIEHPAAAVETFGLLKNSSGVHVLKYNHSGKSLIVNAELGGISTTIQHIYRIA